MSIENPCQDILVKLFAEGHNCHCHCDHNDPIRVDDPSAQSVSQVAEQWSYQYFNNDVAPDHKAVFHVFNHILLIVQ